MKDKYELSYLKMLRCLRCKMIKFLKVMAEAGGVCRSHYSNALTNGRYTHAVSAEIYG